MEKTFSLPRALLIRVEIFGLLFALALLVGLCSGCGDGTEPDSLPDSGMVAKTDSGTIAKTDSGSKVDSQPSSVPCKVPADTANTIGPYALSTLGYLTAVNGYSISCPAAYSQPPYNKATCAELAANGTAAASALESVAAAGYFPCCVGVSRAGTSGPVITYQVNCLNAFPEYVLCSSSGAFLGLACQLSQY